MRYLLVALMLTACGGSASAEPLTLPEWAATYCGVGRDMAAALPDDTQVAQGGVEVVRSQAIYLWSALAAALEEASNTLSTVEAPPEAAALHDATIAAYTGLASAIDGSIDDIRAANATADLDVVLARISIAQHEAEAGIASATEDTDPVVLASLRRCL